MRNIALCFYLFALIRTVPHKNISRNLQYTHYITIYFNQDVNYPYGFKNNYRPAIDYLVKEEEKRQGFQYLNTDRLSVIKGFGLEIHFSYSYTTMGLARFFSSYDDENMKYVVFIDFTHFDSQSISSMNHMFYLCYSLKSIDFGNFDTSQVTNMNHTFYGCNSLVSLNLKGFDTTKVKTMDSMFLGCSSLKSINLLGFDTSNVVYMNKMFYECSSLESLDLSNFNTYKVFDMSYMFFGCNSLKSIDISNFDMFFCDSYDNMFSDISNIKYINLYNFKNDKIISKIFNNNKNNTIFVCEKDDIIINRMNAYNCCNYIYKNYKPYECYSPIIPSDSNITIYKVSDSSSSISIGAIIGIIAGGIAFIVVIIILICCACKR